MADVTRIHGPDVQAEVARTTEARRATQNANTAAASPDITATPSFAEMLRVRQGIVPAGGSGSGPAAGDLKFSAHAQTRLQSRQIALQPAHLDRLEGAIQRAAGKGARDALILMDDMAMVVSIKNRTVVTVVDKDHLKQNVFTNIDSAVIA